MKVAGIAATQGPNNFVGDQATNGNLSATGNLALGGNILKGSVPFIHNSGTDNLFAGLNAGNLSTSGPGRNTGLGVSALQGNTSGSYNSATGAQAMYYNTSGSFNTASGTSALLQSSTGSYNTATGYAARYMAMQLIEPPLAPTTPEMAISRSITTPPAAIIRLTDPMPFLATPPAATTPPAGRMRFPATPLAPTTRPSDIRPMLQTV